MSGSQQMVFAFVILAVSLSQVTAEANCTEVDGTETFTIEGKTCYYQVCSNQKSYVQRCPLGTAWNGTICTWPEDGVEPCSCPENWSSTRGRCLYLDNQSRNFQDSWDFCKELDPEAVIVMPKNKHFHKSLFKWLLEEQNQNENRTFWIGLKNNQDKSDFRWLDGRFVFWKSWNTDTKEDGSPAWPTNRSNTCVLASERNGWKNYKCDKKRARTICHLLA